MSSFLPTLDIALSGMMAERTRQDVITQNLTNAKTTRTEDGTPYVRQVVVYAESRPYANVASAERKPHEFGYVLSQTLEQRRERKMGGVNLIEIVDDPTPLTPVYDPSHPDADESGYYYLPNVDIAEENIDLLASTRSWETHYNVYDALVTMAKKSVNLGKG